ncbi:MAG: T9SS type A sorting domain-containing protein [Candidatus Marinimicrobia bacterium]|nr:T9SS type A sorting domain-containing protein [Candidatus Neomarinimicrobiota bacterium]MCF7828051.1 T9SS type A sorting domain-containing protein [Candidatus Neomarinimicrobiota bacterium]MCF7879194.1 T9SS type A sorting domain-containing protein [Candidatus Neomarinimicrobiota bacterium]
MTKVWPDEADTEYWMSVAMQLDSVPTGNTYYLTKLFYFDAGSDTAEIVAVGKSGGGTTWSGGSGWAGGEGPDVSTVEATKDPVWLVTKIIASGDSTVDRTFMWINPDPAGGAPDTADADVSRDSWLHAEGFNTVAFENGGEMAMTIHMDEFRLGKSWSDVSDDNITTSIDVASTGLPAKHTLAQNYPNPFNPTTNIRFELTEQTRASLSVYNARGELVQTLVDGVLTNGAHEATFNGAGLPSGVYFYRLQAGTNIEMRKMLLIK